MLPSVTVSVAGERSDSWSRARAAPLPRFEDLLVTGGMRAEDVRPAVVRRAYQRYGGTITAALAGAGRPEAAVDAYLAAEQLPSLTTIADFRLAGLLLDGPLFEGSPITRCFRDREELLLKPLDSCEHARALALGEALATAAAPAAPSHCIPYLTTFELHARGDKFFMVMPLYGASLEHLPSMSAGDVKELWRCASGALRGLHALGFAHMDVKPANICLNKGTFLLVDVGSVARFGEFTTTTMPYVACDFPGAMRKSSARADWWQLAMTLAEKGCGEHCLLVGSCVIPTMNALAVRLREHLPPSVWGELKAVLEA